MEYANARKIYLVINVTSVYRGIFHSLAVKEVSFILQLALGCLTKMFYIWIYTKSPQEFFLIYDILSFWLLQQTEVGGQKLHENTKSHWLTIILEEF